MALLKRPGFSRLWVLEIERRTKDYPFSLL
jgi:hypothetical protein